MDANSLSTAPASSGSSATPNSTPVTPTPAVAPMSGAPMSSSPSPINTASSMGGSASGFSTAKTNPRSTKMIAIVFIALVVLVAGFFAGVKIAELAQRASNSTSNTPVVPDGTVVGETQPEQDPEEEVGPVTSDVSATMPTGWQLKVYKDGQQVRDHLPEGTYQGVTAVSILNASNKEVFTIKAASGLGESEVCKEIFKFADTSAEYVTEKQDLAKDVSQTVTVKDLGTNFKEFKLLEVRGRIVGADVYWDASTATDKFNPNCGEFPGTLNRGLVFKAGDKSETTYVAAKTADLAAADVDNLIGILNTLKGE